MKMCFSDILGANTVCRFLILSPLLHSLLPPTGWMVPHSPPLSLNFTWLHFTKQSSTDVVQIPVRGSFVQPAVSAGRQSRGQTWEPPHITERHQVHPWACSRGSKGEVAVECTGRRHGFREAAREVEGTRSRLGCQWEIKRHKTKWNFDVCMQK